MRRAGKASFGLTARPSRRGTGAPSAARRSSEVHRPFWVTGVQPGGSVCSVRVKSVFPVGKLGHNPLLATLAFATALPKTGLRQSDSGFAEPEE